ncbi:MAG: prolipoprotein diacylglyceryl transferase [Clostridia bacterium]|nr:prolipoprotein diacylglyceryl transferase [Clostridia bacterium]
MISAFSVTAFGAAIAGAMAAYLLVMGVLAGKRIGFDRFLAFSLISVPLAFLLSRVVFVAGDLIGALGQSSYYLDTLESLRPTLWFWDGGYSLMGALLGLLLGLFLFRRYFAYPAGTLEDAFPAAFFLALFIERLAEPASTLGFGREVTSEFMLDHRLYLDLDGWPLLRVWRVEALIALILFGLSIWQFFALKKKGNAQIARRQHLFLLFLAVFGFSQTFLESLRDDGHMVVHFVRIQQVLALFLGLSILAHALLQKRHEGLSGARVLLLALLALMLTGLAVFSEFGVDRWGNRLLAYLVMALCLGLLCVLTALLLRPHRDEGTVLS